MVSPPVDPDNHTAAHDGKSELLEAIYNPDNQTASPEGRPDLLGGMSGLAKDETQFPGSLPMQQSVSQQPQIPAVTASGILREIRNMAKTQGLNPRLESEAAAESPMTRPRPLTAPVQVQPIAGQGLGASGAQQLSGSMEAEKGTKGSISEGAEELTQSTPDEKSAKNPTITFNFRPATASGTIELGTQSRIIGKSGMKGTGVGRVRPSTARDELDLRLAGGFVAGSSKPIMSREDATTLKTYDMSRKGVYKTTDRRSVIDVLPAQASRHVQLNVAGKGTAKSRANQPRSSSPSLISVLWRQKGSGLNVQVDPEDTTMKVVGQRMSAVSARSPSELKSGSRTWAYESRPYTSHTVADAHDVVVAGARITKHGRESGAPSSPINKLRTSTPVISEPRRIFHILDGDGFEDGALSIADTGPLSTTMRIVSGGSVSVFDLTGGKPAAETKTQMHSLGTTSQAFSVRHHPIVANPQEPLSRVVAHEGSTDKPEHGDESPAGEQQSAGIAAPLPETHSSGNQSADELRITSTEMSTGERGKDLEQLSVNQKPTPEGSTDKPEHGDISPAGEHQPTGLPAPLPESHLSGNQSANELKITRTDPSTGLHGVHGKDLEQLSVNQKPTPEGNTDKPDHGAVSPAGEQQPAETSPLPETHISGNQSADSLRITSTDLSAEEHGKDLEHLSLKLKPTHVERVTGEPQVVNLDGDGLPSTIPVENAVKVVEAHGPEKQSPDNDALEGTSILRTGTDGKPRRLSLSSLSVGQRVEWSHEQASSPAVALAVSAIASELAVVEIDAGPKSFSGTVSPRSHTSLGFHYQPLPMTAFRLRNSQGLVSSRPVSRDRVTEEGRFLTQRSGPSGKELGAQPSSGSGQCDRSQGKAEEERKTGDMGGGDALENGSGRSPVRDSCQTHRTHSSASDNRGTKHSLQIMLCPTISNLRTGDPSNVRPSACQNHHQGHQDSRHRSCQQHQGHDDCQCDEKFSNWHPIHSSRITNQRPATSPPRQFRKVHAQGIGHMAAKAKKGALDFAADINHRTRDQNDADRFVLPNDAQHTLFLAPSLSSPRSSYPLGMSVVSAGVPHDLKLHVSGLIHVMGYISPRSKTSVNDKGSSTKAPLTHDTGLKRASDMAQNSFLPFLSPISRKTAPVGGVWGEQAPLLSKEQRISQTARQEALEFKSRLNAIAKTASLKREQMVRDSRTRVRETIQESRKKRNANKGGQVLIH
ncbi:hypothetical protein CBR_g37295 [Chara braunii]|uniref:Uncharacterized protein n=1 Tax=Chara braunii TaxID=69332 RepID=A0A388LMM9_CHABU|nr:hypothetical protein CBR_g37295 [Chara braunii]|eukprot:GBG83577.1 hypothetical protein CBR_g37295 [Chara braunii]